MEQRSSKMRGEPMMRIKNKQSGVEAELLSTKSYVIALFFCVVLALAFVFFTFGDR